MAQAANNSLRADTQGIPIILCHGRQADEAFTRYAALRKAERDCPALAADTRFQALRGDAYVAFRLAFEVS